MNPSFFRPATRLVLGLGLVAAAWTIPSASMAVGEVSVPAGGPHGTVAADRIDLAQAAAAPVQAKVSFSAEQVARGERRYTSACVECHGADLAGGLVGGPPLKGLAFEEKFANGAPASALFMFMTSAMPPESPGRFSATAYADLMAFILQGNGFQEGAPLPSDLDALDNLIMER